MQSGSGVAVIRLRTRGFSLVELSIVLVILGLLVGGVLSGQSLIRAAELRSVSSEYQRYYAAVQTFRDKYFALPGDMNNAVRFWGAQAGGTTDGTDATCAALTAAATGMATCNGNGDGIIGVTNGGNYESFRFWQHLANAGLIEGTYSGVAGPGGALEAVIGTNVAKSKLGRAGYSMQYLLLQNLGAGAADFNTEGHALWFGGFVTGGFNGAAVIKPEEAWNLDTKLDDGKPGFGKVISWRFASGVPNCTTSNNALTSAADAAQAEYRLSNSGLDCALRFFVR